MSQLEQHPEEQIVEITLDSLGDWQRSHDCQALNKDYLGQTVILMGWVQRRRDHGGLIFVDLRDRHGITQIVFDPQIDALAHGKAHALRSNLWWRSAAKYTGLSATMTRNLIKWTPGIHPIRFRHLKIFFPNSRGHDIIHVRAAQGGFVLNISGE